MQCLRLLLQLAAALLAAAGPAPHAGVATAMSSSVGASYTNRSLRTVTSVWGHHDVPHSAERPLATLPELDLLRQLQKHAPRSCREALESAIQARGKLRLAQLRMNFASVRLPDALLSGVMYHLGDFDTCMAVRGTSYCLADVEIRPGRDTEELRHQGDDASPFEPPHGDNATLWDLLQTSGNRRRYRRDLQQWGLCLPAECAASAASLGSMLAAALDPLARNLEMDLRVSMDAEDCTRSPIQPVLTTVLQELNNPLFLAGTIGMLSFMVITMVASVLRISKRLSFLGDSWTMMSGKQGIFSKCLSCFSVPGNWKHLKRKQDSQIHCIQGLRTLTMFGVILGHRCFTTFGGPVANPEYVENSFLEVLKMYIINGNIIVSTFFVISGFLEARLNMIQMERLNGYSVKLVIFSYIHRYLRFFPALAFMITLEIVWTPLYGSGPIWNQLVGQTLKDCRADWWSHLLFINNYYNPESLCLYQTWFLAVDMQLYLLAVPLLWFLHRLGRSLLAVVVMALVLVVAASALYLPTALLQLHPVLQTLPQLLRSQRLFLDPTFTNQYVATHCNALPFVVGLISGIVYFHLCKVELRVQPRTRLLLCASIPAAHLLHTMAFYTGIIFYTPGFGSHPWLDALYGPARQILFSTATAWVILVCGLGFGGIFNWILCWTPLMALGRLTYCAFLTHITLINITAGSVRQPVHISDFSLALTMFSDIVFTYMCAFALHVCVEAPLWNIQKMSIEYSMKRMEQKAELSRMAAQSQVEEGTENNNITAPPANGAYWPSLDTSKL